MSFEEVTLIMEKRDFMIDGGIKHFSLSDSTLWLEYPATLFSSGPPTIFFDNRTMKVVGKNCDNW